MENTIATNLNRIRKWKNFTMQELADMAEINNFDAMAERLGAHSRSRFEKGLG